VFLEPIDGLFEEVIEFLGAIYHQQREVDLPKHFPSLGYIPRLVMGQAGCIEVLQLHIPDPVLILELEGLEGMEDLISGVHFGRDCTHLMAELGH
jgi:hypothetical protein